MAEERLQKILARAGVASRRRAEELIVSGRVRVDGRSVTELGARADSRRQRIEVDGRRIVIEPPVYLVLHKPRGVVSTLRDPEGRRTVIDLVRGVAVRVVPVGRLDYHTSGVLLLTNDGELAARLSHPRSETPKVYVAKVRGVVDDGSLERWRERLVIDGRPTRPAEVGRLRFEGDKTWLRIVLREGKNRQIHRLGEASGFFVMRLARVEFAGITCEGLRPGQWRYLSPQELAELQRRYGVRANVPSGSLEGPRPRVSAAPGRAGRAARAQRGARK